MHTHLPRYALALRADSALEALLTAQLHDPLAYLGAHMEHNRALIRVFYPHAQKVWISIAGNFEPMARVHACGVFEWHGTGFPIHALSFRVEDNSNRPRG